MVGGHDPVVWDGTVLAGNRGELWPGEARRGQAGWVTEVGYKLHGGTLIIFVRMRVLTFDESGPSSF